MKTDARIFVAGHKGLVGSALVRTLQSKGYSNLLLRGSKELDLRDAAAVERFFADTMPEYVFLAAAKVGGIIANYKYPVEFLADNLAIQNNVIAAAHRHGVTRLLFLGSSCIYPKHAPQPMREDSLLTGPLEPSNRAYALAKIAGIELIWSYNRQYGTQYTAAMPTNLYGPGDNYHPENSHVIPGLLRKFHEAKASGAKSVTVWGTGTPRREFLFSDDMARACVHILNLDAATYAGLLGSDETATGRFDPPLVNVGVGHDVTIAELAGMVAKVVGWSGTIEYDTSKPDGTPRKLMDVGKLHALGWRASTELADGLQLAYAEFIRTLAA
ncbi:MAG: GDP-L-fucose synthase family protein [Burkholderiales bacterium]